MWPYNRTTEPKGGYPLIRRGGKDQCAHIIVCEVFHGPRTEGVEVRHSCGNRACVAPWHLSWSSHLDNMRDMKKHGTNIRPRGPGNGRWKGYITEEMVQEIRTALLTERQCDVARRFGVSPANVHAIHHGLSWAWVGKEID